MGACRSALADMHAKDGLVDSITGSCVTDSAMLAALCEEVQIADAVYNRTAAAMCSKCILKPDEVGAHPRLLLLMQWTCRRRDGRPQVVKFHEDAAHFKPAFCIAVREATREVLVVVRGTGQLSDALTNLAGEAAFWLGCRRHASGRGHAWW